MRFSSRPWTAVGLLGAVVISLAGCTSGQSESTADLAKATLIEPFTPPTLAEIDAKAEWEDRPVLDPIELLRKRQETETPLCTVAEALALPNDSQENNDKILSALGRLPANEKDVNWGATINRHTPADVKSTNPIMLSSTLEFDIAALCGLQLFNFDWNFNDFAERAAVVSWQASKDHMYDKLVLRNDLTWSDGKPITAHDVVFSWRTIMNPNVPVPAVRSGVDKLRWIEAYDDYTLVFFHKEPLVTNKQNINFPIIPKHIYAKSLADDVTLQDSDYHVQLENNPVCGGMYTIASRTLGQELVLERRESWYMHDGKQVRDKPYFKTVRFRIIKDPNTARLALLSGTIDEMILTPEQWTTQTSDEEFYRRNTKATGVEWVYFYFGWNNKIEFFSDVKVREAMSYAFDYKEMLNTLFHGLYGQSNGIFHAGAWMAPKTPPPTYQQDLTKAAELLKEAGWEDHDGDGVRDKEIEGKSVKFEFSMLCPNFPDRIKICTLLKENLRQVGVICNVKPLESTVLQEKELKHEFQAYFGGWGTGTDPDTSDNIWVTGEGRNFVQYSNPEVDELYKKGRREFDREKRAEIYAKIHELIYKDQPYTFLYFRNSFYGFSKTLRGYTFSPRGPYNFGPGFSSIWKPAEVDATAQN